MAYRQMHLNKSGSGMASKTACGRNVLRTPMSCNWKSFKATPDDQQCSKCAESKQAEVNFKQDSNLWIPEDPEAWKLSDDKLLAAKR